MPTVSAHASLDGAYQMLVMHLAGEERANACSRRVLGEERERASRARTAPADDRTTSAHWSGPCSCVAPARRTIYKAGQGIHHALLQVSQRCVKRTSLERTISKGVVQTI